MPQGCRTSASNPCVTEAKDVFASSAESQRGFKVAVSVRDLKYLIKKRLPAASKCHTGPSWCKES